MCVKREFVNYFNVQRSPIFKWVSLNQQQTKNFQQQNHHLSTKELTMHVDCRATDGFIMLGLFCICYYILARINFYLLIECISSDKQSDKLALTVMK